MRKSLIETPPLDDLPDGFAAALGEAEVEEPPRDLHVTNDVVDRDALGRVLVNVLDGPVLTRPAMSGMPTELGRAGEVEELVNVILFMCSDNASFVTGSNHVVDGGRLCMYRPYVPPKG